MKVFLRRIPAGTNRNDICRFVEPVIKPRWFRLFKDRGAMQSCQLLEIREPDGRYVETHGLVDIEPEMVAAQALLRLNGRKLNGQIMEVRRWHDRSGQNDRRASSRENPPYSGKEKRQLDRRRAGVVANLVKAR